MMLISFANDNDPIQVLGQGSYAKVYLAEDLISKEKVALKALTRAGDDFENYALNEYKESIRFERGRTLEVIRVYVADKNCV